MPSTSSETKSRARSKSPSRRRRSTSRSRSRGRSKSPARKPRQSPSRTTASPSRKSPSRKPGKSGDGDSPRATSTPVRRSARLEDKTKDMPDGGDAKPALQQTQQQDNKVDSKKARSHYEFGGPFGTTFMTLALPVFLILINDMCSKSQCDIRKLPKTSRKVEDYFNLPSALVVFGFLVFQAILAVLPIGPLVSGRPCKSGALQYRCNGLVALLVTGIVFAAGIYLKVDLRFVHQNFRQLICTSIVFSLVVSLYLYVRGRDLPASKRNKNGNTGCIPYDFFMGKELNPRIGSFDIKFFLEMRPGLIGWAVLNWCFLLEAYKADSLSPGLGLVAGAQLLYVTDALLFEDSILSTMDITNEGLGFMLTFGNLAWVPFLYCLQTRYLLEHPTDMPYWALIFITLLNVVGYLIFRGSNSQKDLFRREPHSPTVAHLETVPSSTGRNLLVSGWWGLCQHPNYLGDLLMATAWSLYCGCSSVIPYFYPMYMLVLLVHRQRRDHAHCQEKHGAAWARYCQRVPYRLIPYIY